MYISNNQYQKNTNISSVFESVWRSKNISRIAISKKLDLGTIPVNQTKMLIDETHLDVVASGGAKSINDILKAKEIGAYGIILGKSIYSNAIDLKEAIRLFED